MIEKTARNRVSWVVQIKNDFAWSSIMAGLVAVIVGYAGPTVLVFQVAENAGLTDTQVSSWLWAYSIASGVTTIFLSLHYRIPIITAWSTPGIAFLTIAMASVSFPEAIGAFLVSNLIITIVGALGLLQPLIRWIPLPIASALNGGILVLFASQLIASLESAPKIVGGMVVTYFVVRRYSPRWAVAAVLGIGLSLCVLMGQFDTSGLELALAEPNLIAPAFSWTAMVNIAVPLTVLALSGQYLPGFAVLKTAGYDTPVDKVVTVCGTGSMLVAPFGCHNINPSSMIAAIVAGPESHPDPNRRYIAAVCAGVIYLVFGAFATTFVGLFGSLPTQAIAALAGLALLTAIAGSFGSAFSSDSSSLAPLMTFVIAASGISLFGIGAAFWAIVAGLMLHHFFERH